MASEGEALRAEFAAPKIPPIVKGAPPAAPDEGAALRAEFPAARQPFVPIPQPIPFDTGIGRLRSAGREAMRGAGDIIGSIPKSIGIAQGQANQSLLEAFDTIDGGNVPRFGDYAARDFADIALYRRADAATRKKIRSKVGSIDPRQHPLYQAGEALQRAVKDTFVTNPKFQGEFGQAVAQGIGSTAGFAIAGALTRGAGLSALSGAGLTGAATAAAMQFEDAIRHGAPLEDAFEAAELATVTGATEALPIARLFGRLDKSSGGQIKKIFLEGLKGGGEELLQELVQSFGDNLIASKLVSYDPERGFFQGAGEAAGVGFTVGALFNTVAAMIGAKPRWKPGTPGGPIRGEGTAQFIPTMEVSAQIGQQEAAPVAAPAAIEDLPPPAPPAPANQRTIVGVPNDFADETHAQLYDLGATQDPAEAGRLFAALGVDSQFVEDVHTIEDVLVLAVDYRNEVDDDASSAAKARPGQVAQPPMVIDVDHQTDYLLGRGIGTAPQEAPGAPPTVEPVPAPSPTGEPEPAPVAPEPAPPAAEKPPTPEPAPAKPTEIPENAAIAGDPTTVLTPRGTEVEVTPVLVEAGDLVPSSHPNYPAGLQPRDRSRAASAAQVAEIAGNLEPRLLSADTISASDGAPIVGPDLAVESGNARTMAIIAAYDGPAGQRYREHLAAQGYAVEGMTAPVLVRLRTGEMTTEERNAFAREANERSTAKMSATEQSQADAATLRGSPLLATFRGGDLDLAANRPFVRAFLNTVVAPAERNAVVNSSGELSQEGRARIENALFAAAYQAPDLLEKLREDPDSNIKAIGKALVDVAPAWAQMVDQTSKGAIPGNFDITDALVAATHLVSHARATKSTVGDLVAQQDLFGTGTEQSQTVNALLNLFFRNAPKFTAPRSRKAVADGLAYYLDQADKSQAGPSLIPLEPVSPIDVLDLAAQGGQGDLLPEAAEGQQLPEVAAGALPETAAFKFDPGARHTGRVPDKVDGTPGPAGPGVDPIRREEILAPLLKALKVPLYTGRMGKQPKRVAGFYRRGVEEVRIRKMNDMELAAHELAHMLDDRHPEVRKWWTPATNANQTTRDELKAVSYDQTKLFEGFAEFVRLWSTQNAEAEARAPTMYREFEHWLASHPQEAAIRTAQEQMHAWFEQDAQSRMASKIGGEPLSINEHMTGWRDWARQSILDDLHGVRQFEMDITGGLAPVGAYETSRMLRGNSAMVENVLLYGAPVRQPDGSFRHEGKGLFQILNPLGEQIDNWTHYAVARSAAELKTQGRENLFSDAEIAAGLALETQEFRRAFEEYQEFNGRLLDFAETMGILDPAKRAKFARSQYIPFYRIAQPGGAGSGRGPAPGEWNGIKALTGGTNNLRDIVGNMIGNAQMLVGAAMTNEARQKIAALAHQPKGAHHMAKIPADDKRIGIDRDQVERKILESMGITSQIQKQFLPIEVQQLLDQIIEGMPDWVNFYQFNQSPRGGNIVAVMNGGKPSYYEVIDPILYRSLVMLNRPAKFWLTTVLAIPRRVGQTSVTLSLDFIEANFLRDQAVAWVFSQTGFVPFKDGARGLAARLLKDPDYKDFLLNGGGMASHLLDPDAFKAHMARLDQFYTKKGISPRTVVNSAKDGLLAVEAIANAFEIATRLGEFKRAKARGENPRHAAYLGREVSVDFSMRGGGLPLDKYSQWNGWDYASASVNFLYDTVMFLKAATNGLDRVYRGFAKDPHRVSVAWKTAMIATLSGGLAALNMVNPMYDDLEDWDKDGHWHVFVPKDLEGFRMLVSGDYQSYGEVHPHFTHFRYPKIWEIGGIASIAERALTRVATDKEGELPGDAWRIMRNLLHFQIVPQFYAPIYEQDINRLRFIDRAIVPFYTQERKPYAQYSPGTSRSLVELAEKTRHLPDAMQLNPARAEALLRGYFNTWAMYGLNLSDALLFDEAPDMRLDQYPGLRRLYREHPLRSPRQVTEFWDAVKAATAARRTAVHMGKANRPGISAEERATPENLQYKQLTTAAGRASKVSNLGRLLSYAPDLASTHKLAEAMGNAPTWKKDIQRLKLSGKWGDLGALKRSLLDLTIAQRNRIIKATMKQVEGREP